MKSPDIPDEIAEIGMYENLKEARDHGLVISSMELAHWIIQRDGRYVLVVEVEDEEEIRQAIAEYDAEQKMRRPADRERANMDIPGYALFCMLAVMWGFWVFQAKTAWAVEQGIAGSVEIQKGEWWRVITALTLHGDSFHFISNLCIGAFFFAFALARAGGGLGALLILTGGALGNLINAWAYRGEIHNSLGASTAVFAAMGILVGSGLVEHLADRTLRTARRLIIPIGGGMALFAFFSSGESNERIDVTAHLWGFVSGLVLGTFLFWLTENVSRRLQTPAAVCAFGLLGLAWFLAFPH